MEPGHRDRDTLPSPALLSGPLSDRSGVLPPIDLASASGILSSRNPKLGYLAPSARLAEVARRVQTMRWSVAGGGDVAMRERGRVFVTPRVADKSSLVDNDIIDFEGLHIEDPTTTAAASMHLTTFLTLLTDHRIGAVIHGHGTTAVLASLAFESALECQGLELLAGLRGVDPSTEHAIPIVESSRNDVDLARSILDSKSNNPSSFAVLVRGHGVFVWGHDATEALAHAECVDALFELSLRMNQLGLNGGTRSSGGVDDSARRSGFKELRRARER